MSPPDVGFHGPLGPIKKKRELFQGLVALSQASLAALPLQFPILWRRNVGPTALLAIPVEAGGRFLGDLLLRLAVEGGFPLASARLTRIQVLFTRNPSPTSALKVPI